MPANQAIGQIMMFAGNFAPRNYMFCSGQILSISQNTALFSLLGTTYGGNGQTTFALPDLRGRVPIHFGQGPGLPDYSLGQSGGVESVTLLTGEMPLHSHGAGQAASTAVATATDPAGKVFAVPPGGVKSFSATPNGAMGAGTGTPLAGGSQPHTNLQPYNCINYCIAVQGIFPSRN